MNRQAATLLLVTLGAGGCGNDSDPVTEDAGAAGAAGSGDAAGASGSAGAFADAGADQNVDLSAVASGPPYVIVGEEVTLVGSASVGATSYQWSFGDGNGWPSPRATPDATVTYQAPGRYQAVLTVTDDSGNRRTDGVSIAVTRAPVFTPRQSSTVNRYETEQRVAVVSPDSDELTVVEWDDSDSFSVAFRITTPDEPRTVVQWGQWLAVTCQAASTLFLVNKDDGLSPRSLPLPRGSRPYGAAPVGDSLFVTLQGTGEVAEVMLDANQEAMLVARHPAIDDNRGIAALPDGRLAVTRFRSRSDSTIAEIAVVSPTGGPLEVWPLANDPQISSDTEIGGVPSYLNQVVVSPNGIDAAVPSLQADTNAGAFRNGRPITFETTVRAVTSFFDVTTGREDFDSRKQFDNRGFSSAAVFSSRGDWLFVAMRGSRSVERFDMLTGAQSGTVPDVGFAPAGVALSMDDRLLFVDATLSRELVVYDVTDFASFPVPIARLPVVRAEPLSADVLRGKQLFNDTFDERLAKDGYLTCSHCHLDGDSDSRVWDFTDRGEGLRNTISLLGRAGDGDGPIHWSANFDEVHDFENDIRNAFGGTGLLSEADWLTHSDTLGASKAGLSADLDALAAYVTSLSTPLPSPFRLPNGNLSAAAARGRILFESPAAACTTCHAGPRLTDSSFTTPGSPLLHDVGTMSPGSGQRLGQTLVGIDTPTLHGLWHSAPYLHDGSATTLREVLVDKNPGDQHGVTSTLSATELDDLIAYLRSLDGRVD